MSSSNTLDKYTGAIQKSDFKRSRSQLSPIQQEVNKKSKASPPITSLEENINMASMEDINRKLDNLLHKLEDISNDNKVFKENFNIMQQRMEERDLKWEEDKKQLISRMELLESRIEHQERRTKRNRFVIKGKKTLEKEEDWETTMKNFIQSELDLKVDIRYAYKQNGAANTYIVETENWKQKQLIMQNKNKLKNKDIYIDNDLTKKEREIQFKLRTIAREERQKGKQDVKVTYQKIRIENKWLYWNESSGQLEAKN